MSAHGGTLLRGPRSDDALAIVQRALTMTRDEAIALSRAYEADPNEHYIAQCTVVLDALELTGRVMSDGWFERVFRFQDWTTDTKALHAVADAVLATLVSDIVPTEVTDALVRPWISLTVPV
jgi:hypothetical protein